jgi:butyrate kinase
MKNYKVFAINPGSTSTKIAMFEGEKEIFSRNISHDAEKLKEFKEISDQLPYRKEMILNVLKEEGQTLEGVDAFSARGGGLVNVEGGVFTIGDKLLEHARTCYTVKHPATLGAQLADAFSKEFGGAAFVVNPPDVDEFQDVARVTGLKGVYRESRIHALNQKEIGIRFAAKQGKKYEDMNLIICHIGGGISVTAHRMGKMVDSNDIANGDGPMAPTRCGQLPVKDVVTMCYSGKYTEKEMREKITKTGGLVDHLGTSDAREVTAMIENGNKYAKLIYDSMIYEIGKTAGSMAAVLHGKVDGIVLTGGISHDKYVVEKLTEMLSFIAPITVMAGNGSTGSRCDPCIKRGRRGEDLYRYSSMEWIYMLMVKKALIYVTGLLFMAFGVAFSVNSSLGVSPVNSLPYVISRITGLDLGNCVIGIFAFYILVQILLLRKKFRSIDLTQLIFSTIFGRFVDVAKKVVGDFAIPTYPGQLVMLAISIVFVAIGVCLYMDVQLVNMPMEGMTHAVNRVFFPDKPFHDIKVIMDCLTVVIGIVLSFVFLGKLDGIREGTVICALLVGKLMKPMQKVLKPAVEKICGIKGSR